MRTLQRKGVRVWTNEATDIVFAPAGMREVFYLPPGPGVGQNLVLVALQMWLWKVYLGLSFLLYRAGIVKVEGWLCV